MLYSVIINSFWTLWSLSHVMLKISCVVFVKSLKICKHAVVGSLLGTGIVRNYSTNMQWGYLQNCLRILWFQCSYSLCLSGQNWIFFFIKHVNLRFPWSKDSMYVVNLLDIEYRIRSYVSNLSHDLEYQGSNVSTILADQRAHSNNIFSTGIL